MQTVDFPFLCELIREILIVSSNFYLMMHPASNRDSEWFSQSSEGGVLVLTSGAGADCTGLSVWEK